MIYRPTGHVKFMGGLQGRLDTDTKPFVNQFKDLRCVCCKKNYVTFKNSSSSKYCVDCKVKKFGNRKCKHE